jgi:hypothetical protein
MRRPFAGVHATDAERSEVRPGDDIVAPADVVMDRAFTVPGRPDDVWPWLEQLGKARGGWYLTRGVERLVPRSRRALRRIDPAFLGLAPGESIRDYGGRHETFDVALIERPNVVVYTSRRGRVCLTWSIVLRQAATGDETRILLRLRMAPIKRVWLAKSAGELLDLLTIAGMAAGLRERLEDRKRG